MICIWIDIDISTTKIAKNYGLGEDFTYTTCTLNVKWNKIIYLSTKWLKMLPMAEQVIYSIWFKWGIQYFIPYTQWYFSLSGILIVVWYWMRGVCTNVGSGSLSYLSLFLFFRLPVALVMVPVHDIELGNELLSLSYILFSCQHAAWKTQHLKK